MGCRAFKIRIAVQEMEPKSGTTLATFLLLLLLTLIPFSANNNTSSNSWFLFIPSNRRKATGCRFFFKERTFIRRSQGTFFFSGFLKEASLLLHFLPFEFAGSKKVLGRSGNLIKTCIYCFLIRYVSNLIGSKLSLVFVLFNGCWVHLYYWDFLWCKIGNLFLQEF